VTTHVRGLALRLAVIVVLTSTAYSLAAAGDDTPNAPSLDDAFKTRCPGAVLEVPKTDLAAHPPRTGTMTDLARELVRMKQDDQEARAAISKAPGGMNDSDPQIKHLSEVDSRNLTRLKQIVKAGGFPDAQMVGDEGVRAAWLLTQHADSDPGFQEQLLPSVKTLVERGELPGSDYALLSDRVLVARHKKQIYGSQFDMESFKPFPIRDPAKVDARRASVGLGPLKDYECFLRVMYPASAH